MRKNITTAALTLVLLFTVFGASAFARTVATIYFSNVTYSWGNADTSTIRKVNNSNAIINTLTSAGGYVEGNKSLDARLRLWWNGPDATLGSNYGIPANTRTAISYDYDSADADVFLQLSLHDNISGGYLVQGSWSPDSY